MPKSFKPRRRMPMRRRRPIRRTGRKGPTISRVRNAVVPDKMLVKVPYVDYQVINGVPGPGGLSNYGEKTYALNSIYDPEPGALNTYPLGWKQWSALYQRYRVYAVSYRITLTNLSDDTSVLGSLFVTNTDDTIVPTNLNVTSFLTQPRSRRFEIGNKSGGKSQTVLTGKLYLPKYNGQTSEQYRTSELVSGYLGDLGTSPLQELMMKIRCVNANSGVAMGTYIYAQVNMTYHVELWDRLPLTTGLSDAPDTADGGEEPVDA